MGTFAQCSLNLSSTTLKITRTFCSNFKPNYNITCSVGLREMKDVWKVWLLPDFTEGSFPDVTVIVSSNGVPSAVFSVDFSPVSGRWEWTSNVTVFLSTEKQSNTSNYIFRVQTWLDNWLYQCFPLRQLKFQSTITVLFRITRPDIHTRWTVDTPGFKPFIIMKHLTRHICPKGSHKDDSWREGCLLQILMTVTENFFFSTHQIVHAKAALHSCSIFSVSFCDLIF